MNLLDRSMKVMLFITKILVASIIGNDETLCSGPSFGRNKKYLCINF
jgi:hypothetical protein